MTNEEKQLLLKDLCARLPYNPWVLVEFEGSNQEWKTTLKQEYCVDYISGKRTKLYSCEITVKPYLRPLTSMTEEERKEYKDMNVLDNCDEFSNIEKNIEDIKKNGEENYIQLPRTHAQDYLNSIHVDYRGLIEKGLALEALEGMYEI